MILYFIYLYHTLDILLNRFRNILNVYIILQAIGDKMTLDILENSNSIELADLDFLNLLFKHSINFGKGKVIYEYFNGSKLQNFTKETDIYSIKEKNIWLQIRIYNNHFCAW